MRSLTLQELKASYKALLKKMGVEERATIFDMIFFGSAVKGKLEARDIDVCVVLRGEAKPDDVLPRFSRNGVHLSYIRLEDIFSEPLWLTFLLEGESLLNGKKISEIFGFSSHVLFTYSLKNLSRTAKTRFSHALLGRKRDGLLNQLGAELLGRGALLVPRDKSEEVRSFFELWRVSYSAKDVLLFR